MNEVLAKGILAAFGNVEQHEDMEYVVQAMSDSRVRIIDRSDQYAIRFEVAVLDSSDENGDLQRGRAKIDVTGPGRYQGVAMVNWPSVGGKEAAVTLAFARALTTAAMLAQAIDRVTKEVA